MTGSFWTPAQFIASWKSPREVEPSPNQVSAARCSPRSLKAIARPVATSIMSGSIETIPTQPTRRSPKWTLPSRPPVIPPSRPMYWPKIRSGVTPRIRCAARSRCRTQSRSRAVHRPGRPGRHGLLPEAVVERARDLALAVEHHRPLLDAAHQEHRPQEADPVLPGQVLARGAGYVPGPSRFRRHLAEPPFLVGPTGIRRRPIWCRRPAGSPPRLPCRAEITLRVDGGGLHGVERLWPARLRWRLRGAWLWPAFFGLTFIDGC